VYSIAYSPDGQRIVTGSDDYTAKVWDAKTGTELLTLKGHTNWVYSIAYSPDGQRIVTGDANGKTKVWDAKTGVEVR
jgi:WD40 repeat protein